jgi:hypothetical protein
VRFRERVQPILETYCYGCHGNGAVEGNRTLDKFDSDESLLQNIELWQAVLKNVRAGIMPPAGENRPSDEERRALSNWIKFDVFDIDPQNPDPGRATLRRLNRTEYCNTIRDLMGVDYNTAELFPPDDSGYGFDNIGDVLSVSPLLLEKYLQVAEAIVHEAVPTVSRVVDEKRIGGRGFRSGDESHNGDRMSYYTPAVVSRTFNAKHDGKYHVVVELELDGGPEFDPARCKVTLKADGQKLHEEEYGWADREQRLIEVDAELKQGKRELTFELVPLVPVDQRRNAMDFRIRTVVVRGPLEPKHWVEPRNYRQFFPQGAAPEDEAGRDDYARTILAEFARRAYRRRVDEPMLDRLVALAKQSYAEQGESFPAGIGRAMVAVLASPRFLFRTEEVADDDSSEKTPPVDEYALASRLSYFLWSSMPDDELFRLADGGELRANLSAQVERMLKDSKSEALVTNFAGQWLRARDVENAKIYALPALGLQDDFETVLRELRECDQRRAANDQPEQALPVADVGGKIDDEKAREAARVEKLRAELDRLNGLREMFTEELRHAMRRETEMCFEYVLREDRSVLELIDSNYTFLNETLARHYGIEGVVGQDMRRVELPSDSPRGGVLTQGTLLVVTSNPNRTSPVKRGLHILDNILGTPPPPPPAAVPPLEQAAEAITDHPPTVRELLEQHRKDPLCHSCHARMDPLGLALDNFNALGMFRETENDRPIDPTGELLTGEKFDGIRNLKRIIAVEHRRDFYRCVTEKLLTYALGRGLEYHDEHTIDQIVERLEADGGKFSTLLAGVVTSAPFQKMRRADTVAEARR